MDINFWLTTPVDINNGLGRPMGGAEISAVQLGRELSIHNEVTIFGNTKSGYYDGHVHVLPYFEARYKKMQYLVVVRAHPILNPRSPKWLAVQPDYVLNWSGDAYDQSNNQIFWDKLVAESLSAFVCKSKWQLDTLSQSFPALRWKLKTIHNGVPADSVPDDITKDEDLFIHASTFYRGSHHFLKLWPLIKEKLTSAKLKLYIKTSLYLDDNPQDVAAADLFKRLSELPDVEVLDPIPQPELMLELSRAKLMLYPNDNFLESSCGVAQQSILCGTPVVATASAALPETIAGCGYCVSGNPASIEYKTEFVSRTVDLCTNQKLYKNLSRSGRQRLPQESWTHQAAVWSDFLRSL